MIEKLVVAFFQKIEENEGIIKPNGKSRFFIEELLEKKHGEFNYIDKQKATRLQKKYIDKDPKASASLNDSFLKDVMAQYLSFTDYNDFVDNNQPKNETKTVIIKTEEEPLKLIDPPINSMRKWKKIIALSSIPLLGLLYIPYQNAIINNSDCIVWTGNQYKKTACTTYKAINNKNSSINIDVVKKIEINQDTEFFKNGKAIVWYGKNNKGIIEYFNANIKHPETNVDLQKITRHFLNKHGLLNE